VLFLIYEEKSESQNPSMNFPLSTILIDDEPLAISRLKRLLTKFSDSFEIIGEANNGAEGLSLVESKSPGPDFSGH